MIAVGVAAGDGADGLDGVAHRHAQPRGLDHAHIVDLIPNGDNGFGRNPPLVGEVADRGPLVGATAEKFQDVEGLPVVGAAGVMGGDDGREGVNDGFAIGGQGEFVAEGGKNIGQAAGADADGVLGVLVVGEMVQGADLDVHGLEPPLCHGVERVAVGAVDDEIVVSGLDGVFEDERGVATGEDVGDGTSDEGEGDGEAVEGATGGGVGDDGPARDDHGGGLGDVGEDVAALDQAAARADDDVEAGVACGEDGETVALGDAAQRAEECSVEVDGEEAVVQAGEGKGSVAATGASGMGVGRRVK